MITYKKVHVLRIDNFWIICVYSLWQRRCLLSRTGLRLVWSYDCCSWTATQKILQISPEKRQHLVLLLVSKNLNYLLSENLYKSLSLVGYKRPGIKDKLDLFCTFLYNHVVAHNLIMKNSTPSYRKKVKWIT